MRYLGTPRVDLSPQTLPHADVIYFCSPNNPTGAVATRAQLEALVAHATEKVSERQLPAPRVLCSSLWCFLFGACYFQAVVCTCAINSLLHAGRVRHLPAILGTVHYSCFTLGLIEGFYV